MDLFAYDLKVIRREGISAAGEATMCLSQVMHP